MQATKKPIPRWTAEVFERGVDQQVRDAYLLVAQSYAEVAPRSPHAALWRHELISMHVGRVMTRLWFAMFGVPQERPTIPRLPIHPDLKAVDSDRRALSADVWRALAKCQSEANP